MCGIVGVVLNRPFDLGPALAQNSVRGRDSWGVWTKDFAIRETAAYDGRPMKVQDVALANLRAEPTTEWVRKKRREDVQPYEVGDWVIVHNGTIANDKQLITEYKLKPPTRIDSWVIAALCDQLGFQDMLQRIIGSYAIIACNKRRPDMLYYAMNYRPLYLTKLGILSHGQALSSVPLNPFSRLLPSYTWGILHPTVFNAALPLRPLNTQEKALVVCSGGLDSTVAAAALALYGMQVELLHFDYGCRATSNEIKAVRAIAERLNVPLRIVQTDVFKKVIGHSRLLDPTASFAHTEAGAEYAHEWVPARNLILTSIAVGIAEAHGFNVLALGANLEEAGAYPDNEPEFLNQFGKLLPFSIGDGKQLRIATPVGNLMKHEIVKLGLRVNAPMELTWSCYNQGNRHCGKCGPCFMRRKAFEINGVQDPVFACKDNISH